MDVRDDVVHALSPEPLDEGFGRLRGEPAALEIDADDPGDVRRAPAVPGGEGRLDGADRREVFAAAHDPVEPGFAGVGRTGSQPRVTVAQLRGREGVPA